MEKKTIFKYSHNGDNYRIETSVKNNTTLHLVMNGKSTNNEDYKLYTYSKGSYYEILDDFLDYTELTRPKKPRVPKLEIKDTEEEQKKAEIIFNHKMELYNSGLKLYAEKKKEYNDTINYIKKLFTDNGYSFNKNR